MPRELAFHLSTRPEPWGAADHHEWECALRDHGFVPRAGGWLAPTLWDRLRLPLRVSALPEAGRFTLTVPESDWRAHTEDVARAIVGALRLLADRTEPTFGVGLLPLAPAPPASWRGIGRLELVTLLGRDLSAEAGLERLATLPGLVSEALPGGVTLLHPPLDHLPAHWSRDLEARFLDAEMHLGLPLDPARYPNLSGPAQAYLSRSRPSSSTS